MNNNFQKLYELVKGKHVALIGGHTPSVDRDAALNCDLICSVHNHAHRVALDPHIIVSGWERPELNRLTEVVVVNIANPHAHETLKQCAIGGQSTILYDSITYKETNPHGAEFEWYNVFTKELGTTPFTGITALKLLTMLPIASVFVTGFTFYVSEDGTTFPYLVPPHHIGPQVNWLSRLRLNDSRVIVDDYLDLIIPRISKRYSHTETVVRDGIHWRA